MVTPATASAKIDFDPVSPAQLHDPYPIYKNLRREAPISYSAAVDAWLVARYDDICEVLKDPARFSALGAIKVKAELPSEVRAILAQGIPYVRTLIDNDPPGHTRFRNLVSKAFLPQRIAELEPKIYAITNELIDGFSAQGGIDIMRHFAFPLPGRVIVSILGLPEEDLDDLKRWCDDWMALQSATAPLEQLMVCAHNYLKMQRYFIAKIEERERAPQNDMLSALIQAQIEGEAPLSKDELVRLLMSLLVAGHETTTHSIGNTLALLLMNPAELNALRMNPSLSSQALEEGLRMDPPIQSLFRRVTLDTELGGVRLPAGARVMLLYGSANRDETQFDEPDQFNIQRQSANKHIAFSRGVHFCLGASMAKMEGRVALEVLITRLHNLRLLEGQPLSRLRHFFLRGYEHLHLRWDADTRYPKEAS